MSHTRMIALAMAAAPLTLSAQAEFSARWELAGHSEHAESSSGDRPAFKPGISGGIAVAAGALRGGWVGRIGFRSSSSDLILVGNTAGAITKDAMKSWSVSAEVGHRLVGQPSTPSVTALGLISLTQWTMTAGEDNRSRWGAGLALEGAVPLSGMIQGVVRTDIELTSSLFGDEELPEGYEQERARRTAISLGFKLVP